MVSFLWVPLGCFKGFWGVLFLDILGLILFLFLLRGGEGGGE